MKKFFILASAAIVALASCAKTEVRYDEQPQEIGFKQITGPMTKAPTPLQTGTLGVIADQGEVNYFTDTEFQWHTDAFKANPAKYWPYEGKLDFTVYAPATSAATYTYSTKTLAIPAITAGEAVYHGSKRYMEQTKPNSGNLTVNLQHTSSKIIIQVKGTDIFKVTDLVLNGVVTSGDVAVVYNDDYNSVKSVSVTGTPTPVNVDFVPDAATELASDAKTLGTNYVLPGNQTTMTIKFMQKNGNGVYMVNEVTKELNLVGDPGTPNTWLANHAYTYLITITADEIFLNAQVEDWVDAAEPGTTNGNITVEGATTPVGL